MKKYFQQVAIVTQILLTAGCSSMLSIGSDEYGCKGMPDGVRCMSATDVYAATNNRDSLDAATEEGEVEDYGQSDPAESKRQKMLGDKKFTLFKERLRRELIEELSLTTPAQKPTPIRTPAKVMRILINPWQDKKGNLYTTSYMYTEIEERKWQIGDRELGRDVFNASPLD